MSPGTFAITSLLLGQSVHKILAEQGYPELPPFNNHLPGNNTTTNNNLLQDDYQQRYLSLCLMMTFMIGIIQVVLGFARLGRWISRSLVPTPLISGFNTASAFHIGTHQIKHLLGVHPPRFSGAFSMLRTWMWIMDEFYSKVAWPTLGLGVAAILTMIGLQRVEHWRRKRSTSAAVVATAPATSAQSLLTVQDVAIEQESRLGRHSIDSSLSSTSTSPSLSPIRDASLPTTNPPVAHNNTAPSSRHPSYQVYRGTETGLYNTGATHARPGIKPLNAANYSSNSTSRWPLWRQPQHSGGDHTFLPPGNYPAESAYRSLSDEDEYGLDDDDDEEDFGMKDPRSPKDSVYGTSGQGELYIHVDKCQHSYGSCSGPRRAKSAEALSPPMSVSDRSESSHSASATQDIFTPSTAVPSSSIPSPWTTLLSGVSSPLHGKDGGDGHGMGPKESPIVHNSDQPPSSILSKLKARFLMPIYTILSVAYVPIPDIFLCLVLWTGVTVLFRLDVDYSIKVVGPIPTGLPNVVWPPAMSVMSSWEAVVPLLWPSFLMALVIYVMSLAVAKHFGKQFDYEIDADQEMRAIGLGSLIGSCFGGYACTGNLTRSAILAQTGARTPLATMVSCGVVLMTLLWWTSLIERVPETVLAAVVLVSLQTLIIQAVEARGLWRVGRRMDAVIWWTTFTTVMIFSIEIGLAVGMLVVVLYQVKKHIRGWKQALCQSVFCQRILLILGLQSPLHTSSSRGWHAGDDDDDY
ncbi:hypothetical protein BGW42_008142 [Actinomortierella wolfii]|nr:hypothetical protein BGW42_008142 [Actinomortierella wolfii]